MGTSATTDSVGNREREECNYSFSRSERPVFNRRECCVVSRLRRTLAQVEKRKDQRECARCDFRVPQQEQRPKVFSREARTKGAKGSRLRREKRSWSFAPHLTSFLKKAGLKTFYPHTFPHLWKSGGKRRQKRKIRLLIIFEKSACKAD